MKSFIKHMKHSSVCIGNCDYWLCLQVLISACFYQHGKVISREELEEILVKEKTEEVEVKCNLHCSILFFTKFIAFYLVCLWKLFFFFQRIFSSIFFVFSTNWARQLLSFWCILFSKKKGYFSEPCPGKPQLVRKC